MNRFVTPPYPLWYIEYMQPRTDPDREKSKAVMVRVSPDLLEQIDSLTNEETSRAAVIRIALRAYFKAREKKR